MIISVNWLKKLTDIDVSIDELATLIGARLVEIEEVIDLGAKYKDVIIARVVEAYPLEGSDHLSVVKLDDGNVTPDIIRDDAGYVQVVCGAPNVRAGILVAWLPPKATVPSTFNSDEPFVLDARKLRGVMSNGMIASARELDLFDEHDGILELDEDAVPGASFAKTYELDDYLLDIENKSLTHRPDCFGIVGFAREIAAIQGNEFETPEWLSQLVPDFGEKQGDIAAPKIIIDDPTLSDRYQAVVLSGANSSAKSPLQMQTYLARVGVRPINAVVDITNYLMMFTGQPLHAFDYDKVVKLSDGANEVHVRAGRDKEPLELLDGRMIELTPNDIVIAAGETAIGLAGAMGGANTEIDENTKNIILESATFNLYNLRATQMRHGIFSEAITRFTKGQPAELSAPVLATAVEMMEEFTGAVRVSDIAESYPGKHNVMAIELTSEKVNGVLGTHLTAEDILHTLENVEFDVAMIGDSDDETEKIIAVKHPYWRADIHIDEDIIEEIGRLQGFDSIMPTLPVRDFTAVRPGALDSVRAAVRQALVRAGANEVLTYSFVHGDVLKKVGQDSANSYQISNSISPDLQYYRQSITPSLLGLVHANIKNGYDSFALFELNKAHSKTADLVEGVPAELHRIGLVVASKNEMSGAPYYQAKRLLTYLSDALGLRLEYKTFPQDTELAFTKPFELKRSARVVDIVSNQSIGIVGEYKKTVSRLFKLPDYAAGFELLTEGIELALKHRENSYAPISRYPSIERDICFKVDKAITYHAVVSAITEALLDNGLQTGVSPIDIYSPEGASTKNITIRIKYTSHSHTLTNEEINDVTERIARNVISKTHGVVV